MAGNALSGLLDPRAIAVIGATDKPGRVGRIIFDTLKRSSRPVYPVHPTHQIVLGHKAFNRVEDLPDEVDLAVIATSAAPAVEAAEACGRKGIPFIVPVAGGFSETGPAGKALEQRLRAVVDSTGSRVLGPNTLGIFVPDSRIDTIFVEHGDRALAGGGGVAFVTQSGSVGVEALGLESNIGFGLRAFVGLGNRIDVDEVELLEYFGEDERTTCVALYMESISRGRGFLEVAGRVARRKPVVALKAGRTASGAVAASSHTGKLAGSDRVVSAAFRQFGVQRVLDEEQLCDAARTLSVLPLPRGPRVAIVSPAGGYGVMATDYVESPDRLTPLVMAELSAQTEARIRELVPPFASTHNPIDLTASATDDMMVGALEAVLDDDGVDAALVMALFAPAGISDGLVHRLAGVATGHPKPVVVVAQFGPFTDGLLRRLFDAGVVGFPSVVRGVRAVRTLVERAQLVTAGSAEA